MVRASDEARAVIIATGSELSLALEASDVLAAAGTKVNVVSMPSWDRFAGQPTNFKNAVLPPNLPRISVEAGTTFGWSMHATHSLGIDRFGASAPGTVVMERLGMTVERVVSLVKEALKA